jgi:hypothetical protein
MYLVIICTIKSEKIIKKVYRTVATWPQNRIRTRNNLIIRQRLMITPHLSCGRSMPLARRANPSSEG